MQQIPLLCVLPYFHCHATRWYHDSLLDAYIACVIEVPQMEKNSDLNADGQTSLSIYSWSAGVCVCVAVTTQGTENHDPALNFEKKPQKCTCMSNVLAFSPKPERISWSLTPQLDTIIIEVSSVKGLSLRSNPLRLYEAKHLLLTNWAYGTQDFTLAKLAILT